MGGMIQTRSERDMAEAVAIVWKAARCAMLERLDEKTRKIPEVELPGILNLYENVRWSRLRSYGMQSSSQESWLVRNALLSLVPSW